MGRFVISKYRYARYMKCFSLNDYIVTIKIDSNKDIYRSNNIIELLISLFAWIIHNTNMFFTGRIFPSQ